MKKYFFVDASGMEDIFANAFEKKEDAVAWERAYRAEYERSPKTRHLPYTSFIFKQTLAPAAA